MLTYLTLRGPGWVVIPVWFLLVVLVGWLSNVAATWLFDVGTLVCPSFLA